jgi:methyltransferase (TIGR00027 family)
VIAGERSRTIDRPALMRAAHQVLDDDPKIFRDPFAIGFTDGASRTEIDGRSRELLTPACKLLRSAMVLRARYAEDELAASIENGIRQYVLLGAGLDTFALRQPAHAANLRIFEVDHPATQRWKRQRLVSLGAKLPANLAHVPFDLQLDGLDKALRGAGFDRRKPAFFSWLGVTQYLDERAIHTTLGYIAGLEPGSGISFSFNPPEDTLDGLDREEARAAAGRAAAFGEPWRTRLTAGTLVHRLRAAGFRRIEHLHPTYADRVYFSGRRDGLRAARFEQLISASI